MYYSLSDLVVFVQQQQQELGSFWYLTTNCSVGLGGRSSLLQMEGFFPKFPKAKPSLKAQSIIFWPHRFEGLSCRMEMRILCLSCHNSNYGMIFYPRNVYLSYSFELISHSIYWFLSGCNVLIYTWEIIGNLNWIWWHFGMKPEHEDSVTGLARETWNSSLLSPLITFIFVSFRIIYKRQSSFCGWYVHTIF